MSCCNNKQILMIYYKSAAEASAWGDWVGGMTAPDSHTSQMPCWWCVCTSDHQSLSMHTLLQKHAFTTCTQVYRPPHTHTLWWHTCSLLLMSPLLWQGTNQSRVHKFKGVRDCLVCFSLCYWSHFTGIIAKLSHKPRDGNGLKVDDWERR